MKKTLARAAFVGTLASGAGCGLFAALWAATGAAWAKSCAITCGMFLYHLAIRVIGPLAVRALSPKAPFDPMGPWFRPRAWEAPLYRALGVRRWKNRLPTYDPASLSLRHFSPLQVADHMCRSELVHEAIALLSLLSLLFALPFGAFPVFLLTGLLAAGLDLAFAVAQRYNRPRVLRLAARKGAQRPAP